MFLGYYILLCTPLFLLLWLYFEMNVVVAALLSYLGMSLLGGLLTLPLHTKELIDEIRDPKNTTEVRNLFFFTLIAIPLVILAWFGWQELIPKANSSQQSERVPAIPPAPPISPELETELEALRADLETFEREGLTPAGRAALEKVVTFADQHPEVNVVFYEEAVPWVIHTPSTAPTPDFLAAFVAGNIRALLASGERRTNSYAGTLEVLRVYQWHKDRDPGLEVPSLEAFELLDRKGKLRERLDKVDRKEEKRAAEKAAGDDAT